MTNNGTPRTDRPTSGVALGAAALTTGLMAGSFYVFACAVMPGLARSSDRAYIEVMQHINDVIQNPVFFFGFFGALLSTGLAAWRLRRTPLRWWVFGALAAYALAFVLTAVVNVPLNDGLAAAGDPARIADPAAVRADFEGPWVAWNIVRAALCTLAFGLLGRALVLRGRLLGAQGRGPQAPYLDPEAGSSASR